MKPKVVLAFSGGLDTSYCVLDLRRRGFEVHTAFVDTGGVDDDERGYIESRARELGAQKHWILEAADDLWQEFVVPLVWSNARTLDQYPMLCSDRYLIVRRCLALCDQLGTRHFAHGCTAMGNDQLRFDQTVRSLGEYRILAPIRDLQARSAKVRDEEIRVLEEAGITVRSSSSRYSINENLLGVTVSGSEIDRFEAPDEASRKLCKPRSEWPGEPLDLEIEFEKGRAVALDGKAMAGPRLLAELNRRCGAYGIGRHIYTGDVSIGLKGRIVFECPGIEALQVAHRALEDTINTRWQNQFRHVIAHRWAELVYTGFFYEPHKFDLEALLENAQRHVSGTVRLASEGGALQPVAVASPHMLRDPEAVYAQSAGWSPEEASGFIRLLGQSSTLSARINGVAGR